MDTLCSSRWIRHNTTLQRASVHAGLSRRRTCARWRLIRLRVQEVLDDLPVDQLFNWHHVLHRTDSAHARDPAGLPATSSGTSSWNGRTSPPSMEQANGGPSDNDRGFAWHGRHGGGLSALWHDKAARTANGERPGFDLITMLQANEDTKDPSTARWNSRQFGIADRRGNDTTRNR